MIGRTNACGGGGGLSPNSAVIHVTAPVGSNISFAKGGVVAKVLGPEKSHVSADNTTLAEWYYAISSSNYGTWTVTATLGTDSATTTVLIDSNKQYDMELYFSVDIYMHGEQYQSLTGGFEVVRVASGSGPIAQVSYGTVPDGVISLSVSGSYSNGAVCTVNPINLTQFSTVTAKFGSSFPNTSRLYIMANSTKSGITLDNGSNRHCDFYADVGESTIGNVTLDVSSANGSFYLLIGGFTVSPKYSCTISEWYLN